jgi:hypothetical protein
MGKYRDRNVFLGNHPVPGQGPPSVLTDAFPPGCFRILDRLPPCPFEKFPGMTPPNVLYTRRCRIERLRCSFCKSVASLVAAFARMQGSDHLHSGECGYLATDFRNGQLARQHPLKKAFGHSTAPSRKAGNVAWLARALAGGVGPWPGHLGRNALPHQAFGGRGGWMGLGGLSVGGAWPGPSWLVPPFGPCPFRPGAKVRRSG